MVTVQQQLYMVFGSEGVDCDSKISPISFAA